MGGEEDSSEPFEPPLDPPLPACQELLGRSDVTNLYNMKYHLLQKLTRRKQQHMTHFLTNTVLPHLDISVKTSVNQDLKNKANLEQLDTAIFPITFVNCTTPKTHEGRRCISFCDKNICYRLANDRSLKLFTRYKIDA